MLDFCRQYDYLHNHMQKCTIYLGEWAGSPTSMFGSVSVQSVAGKVGTDVAGAGQGDGDVVMSQLAAQGVEVAVQCMFGGRVWRKRQRKNGNLQHKFLLKKLIFFHTLNF